MVGYGRVNEPVSLIFHTGALGDFVLSWPMAIALRQVWPDCPTVYVTHPSKGQLAARFLQTQAASIETGAWHSLYSDAPALHVAARDLVSRAVRIIVFGAGKASEEGCFLRNLQRLAPEARITAVAALPPAGFAGHATSFVHQQLAGEPELAGAYELALQKLSTQGLPVPHAPSTRILIHPGAGSVRKCWPTEYFLEVASRLRSEARPVEFILGEVELERFPRSLVEELAAAYPLHRPADYVQLAEELLNCQLLITNDNGPGHLAAILGISTLSLFGPTDPTVWRPIGPRARVICGSSLSSITPSEVMEKVRQFL